MTAVAKVSHWISPEEYLEGERFSDIRHEYVDGTVYAMAGASADHNRIALNIATALADQLEGGPCEAFMNDMKLKMLPDSRLFYYPDVFVACDLTDNAEYFRERPTVIFEVLSKETERTDRREKLLAYREIPSVKAYILLEQDRMLATVYRRTSKGWKSETLEGKRAVLKLPEIRAELAFDRIYARTAAGKTKRRQTKARWGTPRIPKGD